MPNSNQSTDTTKDLSNDPFTDVAPIVPDGKRAVFSIKSIMVITVVFAAAAVSMGHLWRAANGDKSEIGHFAVLNAILPMLIVVVASLFFKIFGRLVK